MYRIERCPCCLERMDETCPALVAPFIGERVLGGPTVTCALATCPACGFRCFDARFDEQEMGRLYQGYRGEAYYQVRHRWEPWYRRSTNVGLSEDPDELRTRKANLFQIVSGCLGGQAPARILDYGGDRGQFIPEAWNAERFVYEVSGREPLPGIRAITDLEGATFDLVMLCQVLEHLPEPSAQLEIAAGLVGPAGTLYVEVPLERPELRWAGSRPWTRAGLRWLAGHPWLLRAVDLYSTYFRIRKGIIPPLGFLKASEHINFFTPQSLEALMSRMGFQVLVCQALPIKGAYMDGAVLGCVARRAPGQGPDGGRP